MYHGTIILRPHRRIKHLRTVHSDFKEQITICDHGTIGLFHLLTLTSKWVRPVLPEKYRYSLHTRLYSLRSKMDNCVMKQWRLTVQQSCKNIPCFSTCCKGEINVQIVGDDEDLELSVLRSKHSSKLRWKRSSIQGRKSSIPKKNMSKSGNMVQQTIHLHSA